MQHESGLHYLSQIDQLLIKQKVTALETWSPFEAANKYAIVNTLGQPVYYAAEKSSFMARTLGKNRPFDIHLVEPSSTQRQVLRVHRPHVFVGLAELDVYEGESTTSPIGRVKQQYALTPKFKLYDRQNNYVLKLKSSSMIMSGSVDIRLVDRSQKEIGRISKQWSGLAKEFFTDADNYGVLFPRDLSVEMKATVLGALFLIDVLYF